MDLHELIVDSSINKMITLTQVKSALVSGVIAAVLAVGLLVVTNGDIFNLDYRVIANTAVITLIASVIKVLGTTRKGNFAGSVRVR